MIFQSWYALCMHEKLDCELSEWHFFCHKEWGYNGPIWCRDYETLKPHDFSGSISQRLIFNFNARSWNCRLLHKSPRQAMWPKKNAKSYCAFSSDWTIFSPIYITKKVFKVKQSFKISDKKHALMFLLYNIKYIWHNECPLFESVGTWELQYEWQ